MPSSKQIWSVDNLSEEWASVEVDGGQIVHIPRWMFPDGVREGAVYAVQSEGGADRMVLTIVADEAEEARRLARSRRQVGRKSANDPGGDVTL